MGYRTANPAPTAAIPVRSMHVGDVHMGQLEIDPVHMALWLAASARIMAQEQAKALSAQTPTVEQDGVRRL